MELFLQQQSLFMTLLKLFVFIVCLFLVVVLFFYNWLYLSRLLRSNHAIGLKPPRNIHQLMQTSLWIPFVTAMCILFFLMTGFY